MLGASCSPCCCPCSAIDNKPCTDPADEGTWVPVVPWPDRTVSGNVFPYAGVGLNDNWSLVEREVHGPGNTWFFFGSGSTSKVGGNATPEEASDWGNLCNWYSAKSNAPPAQATSQSSLLTKRATRLPDEDAVIHVYSPISTASAGPQVVKSAYFWARQSGDVMTTINTDITATATILSAGFVSVGTLFHFGRNLGVMNGGAAFIDPSPYVLPFSSVSGGNGGNATNFPYTNSDGVVNGGALFCGASFNWAVVNGGAEFITQFAANRSSQTAAGAPGLRGGTGVVNGGAIFRGARNQGPSTPAVVNGGAEVRSFPAAPGGNLGTNSFNQGTINGGAQFFDSSGNVAIVNDGAVFNDASVNGGTVNGGAIFYDLSINQAAGQVNGGAEFFDQSKNAGGSSFGGVRVGGIVNGGATFNDDACSEAFNTVDGVRIFRANFTDLPTCNGTAPPGSDATATCGCG
jgi:hypothetical protein